MTDHSAIVCCARPPPVGAEAQQSNSLMLRVGGTLARFSGLSAAGKGPLGDRVRPSAAFRGTLGVIGRAFRVISLEYPGVPVEALGSY